MDLEAVTAVAVAAAAGVGALRFFWTAVIRPAAKEITQRELTRPLLAQLSSMQPPLLARLSGIENRLDQIEEHLTRQDENRR